MRALVASIFLILSAVPSIADDPVYVVRPQGAIAKSGIVLPNDAFQVKGAPSPAPSPVVPPSNPDGYTWKSYGFPMADRPVVKVNVETLGQFSVPINASTGHFTDVDFGGGHPDFCHAQPSDTISSDEGRTFFKVVDYEGNLYIDFHKPGKYGVIVLCLVQGGTKMWSSSFEFTAVDRVPKN